MWKDTRSNPTSRKHVYEPIIFGSFNRTSATKFHFNIIKINEQIKKVSGTHLKSVNSRGWAVITAVTPCRHYKLSKIPRDTYPSQPQSRVPTSLSPPLPRRPCPQSNTWLTPHPISLLFPRPSTIKCNPPPSSSLHLHRHISTTFNDYHVSIT